MKAKLLCKAGEIDEETAVDIVTHAGVNESRSAGDVGGASTTPAPVYEVADGDGHVEKVDTRDLEVLP